MTYESFLKIVLGLQKQDKELNKAYKLNIDLMDFVDPYHEIISTLIKEIYGSIGYDWFSWFCYENNYGQKGLGAWDENNNPICHSIESLYQYLEENHKK